MNRTLIVGASSRIAQSIVDLLLRSDPHAEIACVSRSCETLKADHGDRIQCFTSDYSENSISGIVENLDSWRGTIARVLICNGLLHDDTTYPEKRLEELEPDNLTRLFQVNALIPLLWVKHLLPLLKGRERCVLLVFSARVGSIADNRRGGWYGYRGSKAALNMMLKSAALEYRRRAGNVELLVFHPGTTDTPLTRPFQHSVPREQLFSPDFVAERVLQVIETPTGDEEHPPRFLDWDGQVIPW